MRKENNYLYGMTTKNFMNYFPSLTKYGSNKADKKVLLFKEIPN